MGPCARAKSGPEFPFAQFRRGCRFCMIGVVVANRLRFTVLLFSLVVALIIAGVWAAWILVGADHVRERVEVALDDALGMEVQTGQPLQFGLLRGLHVTLTELEAHREGQLVATVDSARVRISLLNLLTGQVRPLELHLERPEFAVERLGPGVFNVYQPETDTGQADGWSLRRLRLSDARLDYLDRGSELQWLFEHCDADLRDLRHAGGVPEQVLATLAAVGELTCQTLTHDRLTVSDVSIEVRGESGVFELEPISATAFEGQLAARLEADLISDPPDFRLEGRMSQFDLGAFTPMLAQEKNASGKLDLDLALTARGRSWQDVRDSASGTIDMASGQLTLDGYDLDDELEGYATTQRFNLIDAGAVLLAGPVGLVASRGYAFSGLLGGDEGSTRIEEMVSEWTVEAGVAEARDVAFRTAQNRLALAGGLDFGNYSFADMRVAVIDRDGCAVVEQRISGPFREPEIKQPNFLVTAIGPLLDLVKHGIEAVRGDECEVFYSGSIPHP